MAKIFFIIIVSLAVVINLFAFILEKIQNKKMSKLARDKQN